jgi:hypothetical protein
MGYERFLKFPTPFWKAVAPTAAFLLFSLLKNKEIMNHNGITHFHPNKLISVETNRAKEVCENNA